MRKTTLSIVSVLALNGLAVAGGDIAPVEPIVETPVIVEQNPYYIGIGIGNASVNNDNSSEEFESTTLMLQAGYLYSEYIAIEGRYTFGLDTDYSPGNTNAQSNDYSGDFSSWGIYVKPMYPVGNLNLYALLGYGGVMLDDLKEGDAYESGLQWGLGASYTINDNYDIFVDYVSLYDDTGFDYRARLEDVDADTWTFGVSYKF